MTKVCSSKPSQHGYWDSALPEMHALPSPAVSAALEFEFFTQRQGWYLRTLQAGPQGLVVGRGQLQHCLICGSELEEK